MHLRYRLSQFFLVGMILHFLLHTWGTFKLGIDISFIRLRKEVLIAIGGCYSIRLLCTRPAILRIIPRIIRYGIGILGIFCVWMVISSIVNGFSIGDIALAVKYDVLFFGIFLIALILGIANHDRIPRLLGRYTTVMKRCLVIALLWWIVAVVKPGTFSYFFGHNRTAVEGEIGQAPPVVYYTSLTYGYVRSSFLFERPIMRGFFLVAFFPLFFYTTNFRRRTVSSYRRYATYALNIFLTFARSAWIAFAVVSLLCYAFDRLGPQLVRRWKEFLLISIGACAVVIGILFLLPYHVRHRQFSTTGHIEMTKKGLTMLTEKPFFGHGPATAGPGSFQRGDRSTKFNPENQFLQIFVEFGFIGGIIWLILIALFPFSCFWIIYHIPHRRHMKEFHHFVSLYRFFGFGIVGLSLIGLLLHSFSDRMSVYPFFYLYGLVVGGLIKTISDTDAYKGENAHPIQK